MSLNDTKIRSLKPSEKPFKVSDSHGLYLLVNPSGSRFWYLKYQTESGPLTTDSMPWPVVP
ncbi:Arm DNA-binding domain-containing protein [Yersinia enterocolitica]|uniref:Arm DNA-binding domain-containing protein n=1 Tax=Yersinia sp. 2541 StPb PI TaxID=3117407 RepID=UPI0009F2CC6D